jgi:outer membrane protein
MINLRIVPKYAACLFMGILFFRGSLAADQTDELEWGGGIVTLRINHYRGSNQFKNYYIPSPYFSYKSETLEAEPSFVRGVLFKNDFLTIKLSLMLGLSVESEENRAREGMPDLGYLFEAGPMIILNIWQSKSRKHQLTFESPIRQVFATDFTYVEPVGIFGVPFLNFISFPQKYTLGWRSEFSVALMYGNKSYHDYFYTVEARYEKNNRPEYHARGGYSGIQLAWILNKKIGRILLIPFIRYDNLKYAVFEDSPLVITQHYFAFGLGSFFIF